MADYGLKYWWKNGSKKPTRLEILQRDYTGTDKEIYALQSLTLSVQGEQDSVESPIVKTSLNAVVIDCFDKRDTDSVKYGNWEEFFTPDSTLYRFDLYIEGVKKWSGYLTPDSYEEDLVFRSSISITARDNIGHLQDFDFDLRGDMDGMVSLEEIITTAMDKISFAMSWTYIPVGYINAYDTEGTLIDDIIGGIYVNVEAFDGKDYYQALESIFNSLGLVMRYVGDNRFLIMPLRYLHAYYNEAQIYGFLDNSGHRSLMPAVKKISDIFTYEKGDIYENSFESSADYTLRNITIEGTTVKAWKPIDWDINGNIGCLDNYVFGFNPRGGGGEINVPTNFFISVYNNGEAWDSHAISRDLSISDDTQFKVAFSVSTIIRWGSSVSYLGKLSVRQVTLHYSIKAYNSSSVKWYDGSKWIDQGTILTIQADATPADETGRWNPGQKTVESTILMPFTGKLSVIFYGFEFTDPSMSQEEKNSYIVRGAFANIDTLRIEQTNISQYKERKTETIYDEKYNVVIRRTPEFGQVPGDVHFNSIINGFYEASERHLPVQQFSWSEPSAFRYPIALFISRQILTFYAKSNDLITGNTLTDLGPIAFPFVAKRLSRKYVMISGTLDAIAGTIANATLREYQDYDDIWLDSPTLKIIPESMIVPAEGGEIYVDIVANVEWNAIARIEGPNIIPEPREGNSSQRIKVIIPENIEPVEKSGYISVASLDPNVPNVVCQLTQLPAEAYLTVDPTSVELDGLGNTKQVKIDTNIPDLSRSVSDSWIKANVSTAGMLDISADIIGGRLQPGRSGYVSLSGAGKSARIDVTQLPLGLYMQAIQEEYPIGPEGGTVTIVYGTNAASVSILFFGATMKTSKVLAYDDPQGTSGQLAESSEPAINDVVIPGDPGASDTFGIICSVEIPANTSGKELRTIVRLSSGDVSAQSVIVQSA